MAINNFKPFATAANANVTAQADWETLPALLSGFMAGKASSAQVNKAIRQASFIAAALAQYTANKSGLDVLDDGDLNGFVSKMGAAFGKDFQALDATLTALAGLATGANKLPYFTGTDTAAQTDLTSVGRDIIGKSTIADILTYLRLQFFLSEPSTFDGSFTSVLSPDEKLRIVLANNGVWGVQDNVGNVVPLPLERGGLGATDVSGALRVLGLDYGSLLPVGVPIPWVFETPPTGFLKYNGASFNKAMYPKLAQIFPSGVLLDLRGVFIRGWDDGKGIDAGRAILTQQQDAQQNITGMVSDMTVGVNAAGTGAFSMVDLTTSGIAAGALNSFYQKHIYLDSSRVVRTATENRPVNIAFNYIVRAA